MSAELVGKDTFDRDAAQVVTGIAAAARAVASRTADRVAVRVRSRVRAAAQARLRAAVRVVEDATAQHFAVGFDDYALIASGLPAMTPIWHEFGTRLKIGNPALADSVMEERTQYVNEMRDAVGDVLDKASSR